MTTAAERRDDPGPPMISVEAVDALEDEELDALAEATRAAVADGEDIAWLTPPPVDKLRAFWKGVLSAPRRQLVIGRFKGRIAGAVQLVLPGTIHEAGAHQGTIETFFVAPFARGHGLARALLEKAEELARRQQLIVLDLSIRADRSRAIELVERLGYRRWAEKPHYALIDGRFHAGYFYTKTLDAGPHGRKII
ncbi:MAG: GNAT family N-acetyltransferase [Rhodothalassiaceae bacterium]|nr:MAG: GNAT family N-acetyltransferase [Rhodothalassiaceae bacterium]